MCLSLLLGIVTDIKLLFEVHLKNYYSCRVKNEVYFGTKQTQTKNFMSKKNYDWSRLFFFVLKHKVHKKLY